MSAAPVCRDCESNYKHPADNGNIWKETLEKCFAHLDFDNLVVGTILICAQHLGRADGEN